MTKINMKLNWYYYKQQQKTFKDRTENQQKVLSTLMYPSPPPKKKIQNRYFKIQCTTKTNFCILKVKRQCRSHIYCPDQTSGYIYKFMNKELTQNNEKIANCSLIYWETAVYVNQGFHKIFEPARHFFLIPILICLDLVVKCSHGNHLGFITMIDIKQ